LSFGFTLPFRRSTGSLGYFDVTNDEIEAIKQNIISLLITNWGERLMHYNFGVNLIEFLFEPIKDEEIKEKIRNRIINQVDTWLSYVTLDVVRITFPEENPELPENGIGIFLKFHINNRADLSGIVNFTAAP
jgi:phage baseplate assembly protein W